MICAMHVLWVRVQVSNIGMDEGRQFCTNPHSDVVGLIV